MIVEVIILVAGAYLGKNVKVSVSEDAQRIAKRLLQTGLAQLPSADTVKDWAVGAIASARSQSPALAPVQEVSDEVLKEIEEGVFVEGSKWEESAKDSPNRADEMDATRDERVSSALEEARQQKVLRTVFGSK